MNQLNIKHGIVHLNDELFNFHFPQQAQANWEKALRGLGINGDIKIKDWEDSISESDFLQKCKLQPDADNKNIYFSDLNPEQIKKVLHSGNPAQTIIGNLKLTQNNAAKLSAILAEEQAEAEKQEKQYREECLKDFKTELEQSSVKEIDKQKLKTWIKDCDKALLDNILAYFKDEEGVKASAISTKRNKVVKLVINHDDKDIAALIYHAYRLVTSRLSEISKTKEEYEAAKEIFDEKKEEYADAKKGLKDEKEHIAEMSTMLIVDKDPDACKIIQREQLKRNLAKAKKKRESIKRQGLINFSRGVAMAAIEGKADAYIATAMEVGEKVKTATENVMRIHPSQGIVSETLEQNEAVLDSVIPTVTDLVKLY